MKKNKKYLLIFLILFFFEESFADSNTKFLSLKNNEVNLRQGPSYEYPIKFIYKKKYLPLKILDKSGNWIKIIDFENNSGWLHSTQVSKKKTAICKKKHSILYTKATIFSKPVAKLEIGRLVLINKCKKEWCKITSGNFEGWINKNFLWGKFK
tara:strand:- start:48 stop:506 length:459 start_codon:yes stop_codon:yes gene_type:complete